MASLVDSLSSHYHALLARINARPGNAAVTGTAVTLALTLAWVLQDFRAWRAFGTGGTPPTWAGYWRMTKIRASRLLLFGRDDLRDPSPLSTTGPRYLDASTLPARPGPRPPIMSRTMPQRQVPYADTATHVEEGVTTRVAGMMASFAAQRPDLFDLRPSKTEGGTTVAIYGQLSLATLNEKARNHKLLGTEIAHAHPSDGSLHVWMSQADARTVVEKGWGERFPLAIIDKGWTLVYAPRTLDEVEIVERIVKAGAAWITGVEM